MCDYSSNRTYIENYQDKYTNIPKKSVMNVLRVVPVAVNSYMCDNINVCTINIGPFVKCCTRVVAQWLVPQIVRIEWRVGTVRSLYVVPVHAATDNGIHLFPDSLRASSAASLNASSRSQDGVV